MYSTKDFHFVWGDTRVQRPQISTHTRAPPLLPLFEIEQICRDERFDVIGSCVLFFVLSLYLSKVDCGKLKYIAIS